MPSIAGDERVKAILENELLPYPRFRAKQSNVF
jgi:hypothetical protein